MLFRRFPVMVAGLLLLVGTAGHSVQAQPDSVRTALLVKRGFSPTHSPTDALWRSAVVPGWGQYYNRQYYKIPFIYAGFAALGIRIYTAHQEYLLFKRAHLFGRGPALSADGSNPYQQYQAQFNKVVKRLGGERLSAMRSQRDQFRRQRDLAILGSGLLYALAVLDAYVSAHLLTFDVGEELSVRARPVGPLRRSRKLASPGQGAGLQLALRF